LRDAMCVQHSICCVMAHGSLFSLFHEKRFWAALGEGAF
jgi:hypothetical protein